MMRRVIFALAALLLLSSCSLRRVGREEVEPEEKPTAPLFDPLAAAIDRVIVPEEYPIRAAAAGATEDSLAPPVDMDYREFDSAASVTTPTDVYRVQIFTSRLYSEATRELAIAEEIFNLPFNLISLNDLKIRKKVAENGKNYEENAILKAKFYSKLSKLPILADDSGLEIEILNGWPGIKSRRKENIKKEI